VTVKIVRGIVPPSGTPANANGVTPDRGQQGSVSQTRASQNAQHAIMQSDAVINTVRANRADGSQTSGQVRSFEKAEKLSTVLKARIRRGEDGRGESHSGLRSSSTSYHLG
jgi:hypothetical protein